MLPNKPMHSPLSLLVQRSLALLVLAAALTAAPVLPAAVPGESFVDQALRGQSRFLALAAEQALEEWQPDKALLLALNALPGAYGGDRPLVPAARMALHRAVYERGRLKRAEVEEAPLFAVVSPASGYLAVVPEDAEVIEVFEVSTGTRVLRAVHDDATLHAAFSNDDRLLATLGDDGLRLWDLAAGSQLAHHDGREPEAAPAAGQEAAPDQSLASVFASLALQPVDLPQLGGAGNRDPQLPLVAFDPEGAIVAFVADGGTLEVRRIADGELLHRVDVDPKFLYFDDDGARIMVLDRDNDEFVAVDVSTGEIEQLAEDLIVSKTLSGAEGLKLGAVENGHLILFNALGERTTEIKTRSLWPVGDDDPNPSGSLRASTLIAVGPGVVAGGTGAGVLAWDPEKKTQLEHFRSGRIASLAVSADGEYVVAGRSDGEVWLWDTDAFGSLWAEAKSWQLPSHAERLVYVGFAENFDTVVSLAADRSLTFHQLPARKTELKEWGLSRNPAALLSRDGRWVSKYDERLNTLDVWDTRTGEKRTSISRTLQPLDRNSFHPDSGQLLISSPFSTVLGEEQPAAEILDLSRESPRPGTAGRPAVVHRSVYAMAGGRIITAATEDKPSFSIWDAGTGRLLRHVEDELLVAGTWLGSRLLTRSGQDLMLHDLDDDTSALLDASQLDIDGNELAAEFDDRGTRLLLRSGSELTLWDLSTNRIIDSLSASTTPTHFGLSADGSRWFAVDDGVLTVRQGGIDVDQIEVEEKNLLFALIDERLVTVTRGGSLVDLTIPRKISVEEAIAQLPAGRSCLTPSERRAYDLAPLTDAQWLERGCPQFAASSPSRARR